MDGAAKPQMPFSWDGKDFSSYRLLGDDACLPNIQYQAYVDHSQDKRDVVAIVLHANSNLLGLESEMSENCELQKRTVLRGCKLK